MIPRFIHGMFILGNNKISVMQARGSRLACVPSPLCYEAVFDTFVPIKCANNNNETVLHQMLTALTEATRSATVSIDLRIHPLYYYWMQ